jgi:hypothetical protein
LFGWNVRLLTAAPYAVLRSGLDGMTDVCPCYS